MDIDVGDDPNEMVDRNTAEDNDIQLIDNDSSELLMAATGNSLEFTLILILYVMKSAS